MQTRADSESIRPRFTLQAGLAFHSSVCKLLIHSNLAVWSPSRYASV
jgi:hypothetical protein